MLACQAGTIIPIPYAEVLGAVRDHLTSAQWSLIQSLRQPSTHEESERVLGMLAIMCGVEAWETVQATLQSRALPDENPWRNPAHYRHTYAVESAGWNHRASRAAVLIREDSRGVLDVGCGQPMHLRQHLPRGATYFPADLVQWTNDTLLCDLNAGQYPLMKQPVDTVVALGILEYVDDYKQFFCQTRKYRSEVIIFTSVVPYLPGKERREGPQQRRTSTGSNGRVFERHTSLYFHEIIDAARTEGGFVVSYAKYYNANIDESGTRQIEDFVLLKLLPTLPIPNHCAMLIR